MRPVAEPALAKATSAKAPSPKPTLTKLALAALLLVTLGATAQAAAFDALKADLAECLRFERGGAQRQAPAASRTVFAIQRCGEEMARLDRADGRRLRGDHGLSPSSRSVLDSVFGSEGRGRPSSRPR
ncbi:hypothetical protein [Methylobacterium sp. Leaf118]|uniref:hypothetical protein n=1 Tax=Methylobacterium sp. Leaf118 TaxID=2876562 RepID=UPI001E61DF09|nr:hypothetical protein [Methylobacterium sp. Leaf118]